MVKLVLVEKREKFPAFPQTPIKSSKSPSLLSSRSTTRTSLKILNTCSKIIPKPPTPRSCWLAIRYPKIRFSGWMKSVPPILTL